MVHKLADWLHHPCRLACPQRSRAVGKISSGPQVGKLATSPLPGEESPTLQSGGQNQKWPTSGQMATPPLASGGFQALHSASQWGTKSAVVDKWADWLHHSLPYGGSRTLQGASEQVTKSTVAHMWAWWLHQPWCRTFRLPHGRSPPLQSGRQIRQWPTSGHGDYITPGGDIPHAVWGVPKA